jgi:hypothetical protein
VLDDQCFAVVISTSGSLTLADFILDGAL